MNKLLICMLLGLSLKSYTMGGNSATPPLVNQQTMNALRSKFDAVTAQGLQKTFDSASTVPKIAATSPTPKTKVVAAVSATSTVAVVNLRSLKLLPLETILTRKNAMRAWFLCELFNSIKKYPAKKWERAGDIERACVVLGRTGINMVRRPFQLMGILLGW